MLSRRARLTVPGLALAGIAALTGAAAPGSGAGGQVRAAEQPQLGAIEAPAAWRLSQGRGVTVAVLDTGVDATVADLAGSVTTGPDYTLGADPPGYQPPHLHGTYIASIIAGHGSGPGDDGGIIGIAPAARVLSVRVILDDQEPGIGVYNSNSRYANAIDDGIRYATRHGAQVINMSLGTGEATRPMQSALDYAVSHGVVVVASAGNSGGPGPGYTPFSYPAGFTGVISVAAVNGAGQRAPFSDQNSSVELSAPGVSIIGAGPPGTYLQASGTSPASAFVAGAAALIRSAYPRLTPAQVAQALISSTRHRPRGGYSPATGFGEVDAVAALHAARRLAVARPASGLAARGHFGTAAGPVQVTHRDPGRIAVLAGVAAAGTAGVIIALIVLTVLTVRTVRDRRRPAASGPAAATAPFGAAAPAALRNVGLIELLEPADPAETGLGDVAGPEFTAGRDRPAGPEQPAGTDPELGTETGP
jgi:type VII secretion-associated serine protease mycosin